MSGACVTAILSIYTTCRTVITLLIIITDEGASLPAVAFWCENYGVKASKYNLTKYWNSTQSQQYKHLVKLHYNRQPTNNAPASSELLLTIASVDCIVSYKDACCSMILLLSDMLVRLGWCGVWGQMFWAFEAATWNWCSVCVQESAYYCNPILWPARYKDNLGSRSMAWPIIIPNILNSFE